MGYLPKLRSYYRGENMKIPCKQCGKPTQWHPQINCVDASDVLCVSCDISEMDKEELRQKNEGKRVIRHE